ncbi:right-handed parallel beta-helix repeat-containing protein [Saccharophagus degradans]|uniref:Right handed beta helix domain-containing protein n=1 Tax=Saccharophagus degradans (strain 2-40 / ATCC 43961 / DSM 17024) TaxID=203122 RepID=Q21PG4_SACD2|nr:right-handed parallel beta-helix repeat-containing protein [Saccharophagus degradans]ABD79415.1 hypothetical protein Sde_0151 [Saccharophagus degradans 2-40]
MKILCRGAITWAFMLMALNCLAQDCSLPEHGDLFVDKDWHSENNFVGEMDGKYPETGVAPFRTIQQMLDAIQPGQCGFVRASEEPYIELGKKPGEAVAGNTFMHGGESEEARVIVSGYPGERPVIDIQRQQDGAGHGVAGFLVARGNYITIRNFEIRNTTSSGIMMHHANTNEYITVENCHIHHSYGVDNIAGVRLDWCINCLVRNNVIHDTYKIASSDNVTTGEPVMFHSGVHGYRPGNTVIEHNLIYNVKKGVYQKEPHPDGLKSNVVRYNIFHDIDEVVFMLGNMGAGMTPSYGAEFHHNLLYNTEGGVTASFYEANGTSTGLKVYNNTAVNVKTFLGMSNVVGVSLYNNLFYEIGPYPALMVERPGDAPRKNGFDEIDYNLYYNTPVLSYLDRSLSTDQRFSTLSDWKLAAVDPVHTVELPSKIEQHGVYADPKFVSLTDRIFTPLSGSPAIAAGKGGSTIGAYGNGVRIGPDSTMVDEKIVKMRSPSIN